MLVLGLISRVNFVHKAFPFLAEATFEQRFKAPERQLNQLMEQEARLVFEAGKYSVWEL